MSQSITIAALVVKTSPASRQQAALLPRSKQASGANLPVALTREAEFFAKLDQEVLEEDEDEDGVEDSTLRGRTPMPPQQTPHVPSPPTALLPIIHPQLQIQYEEYAASLPSTVTPMPLQDFCKVVGRAARGVPVFVTPNMATLPRG